MGEEGEASEAKKCCQCATKTRVRTDEEFRSLVNRLSRIEGQVKGIKAMLQADAYCTDILTQVSAAQSAFNSFAKELISEHIKTCVACGIREGRDDVIDELVVAVKKLMK